MSNYLSNLIKVALHPGGDVYPRLSGRFEVQPASVAESDESIVSDLSGNEVGLTDANDIVPNELTKQAGVPISSDDFTTSPIDDPITETHLRQREALPIQPPSVRETASSTNQITGSENMSDDSALISAIFAEKTADGSQFTRLSTVGEEHNLVPPSVTDLTTATDIEIHLGIPSAANPDRSIGDGQPHPSTPRGFDGPSLPPVGQSTPPRSPSIHQHMQQPRSLSPEPILDRSELVDSHYGVDSEFQLTDIAANKAEPLLGQINGDINGRATQRPHFIEASMDESLQLAKPEPASTVRVTIGRIEIKATTAPDPQPQSSMPRRQPALPLDQYLQRRNEGRR